MRLHVGITVDEQGLRHAVLTRNAPSRARPAPVMAQLHRNGFLNAEVCRPLSAAEEQRMAMRRYRRRLELMESEDE